jgi:hypothetical protein
MASAALINDDLQIDGINMYTATNTFGVPTDGFYKDQPMSSGYSTQINEDETVYTDENTDLTHFTPLDLNQSGSMYLKTASANSAPYDLFPARKYEYDNGLVTYERPGTITQTMFGRLLDDANIWKVYFFLILITFAYIVWGRVKISKS